MLDCRGHARIWNFSQNHVMKVVNELARSGYVESVRGRFGGIPARSSPEEINIGKVVRHTEEGFDLVDCGSCVIRAGLRHDRAFCRKLSAHSSRYSTAILSLTC